VTFGPSGSGLTAIKSGGRGVDPVVMTLLLSIFVADLILVAAIAFKVLVPL
jgi:hypothetical protein